MLQATAGEVIAINPRLFNACIPRMTSSFAGNGHRACMHIRGARSDDGLRSDDLLLRVEAGIGLEETRKQHSCGRSL